VEAGTGSVPGWHQWHGGEPWPTTTK
jgi:hypothetical protein